MMSKRIMAAAMAAAMVIALAGCQQKEAEATGGTRTTAAATTTTTAAATGASTTTTITDDTTGTGDAAETTTGAEITTTTGADETGTTTAATTAGTTAAGGTRTTTAAKTTAATKPVTTTKAPTNTADPWAYPYNRTGIANDCRKIVEECGVKWDAGITRNNCDDSSAFDSYKIEWIDPYTNEYNVVRKDKATLQAELREWLQSAKEVNQYGKIVSAVNVLVEPHWEEKGELYFRIVYKEKNYDFGTQPTEVRADGTVIKLFPDDPWRYPYDTDVMIADCKAYIESKGLIWDDALNVDKGTWAGSEDSGGCTLKPEKFNFKTAVYGKIDYEAWSWDHKYFKCVFIPSEISPGDYDIYVVHDSAPYSPDFGAREEDAELAAKAIN